jgi:hypothetical protein
MSSFSELYDPDKKALPGGIPMSYFVTGATGFIGRFLIDKLIQRDGPIYVLVRKAR